MGRFPGRTLGIPRVARASLGLYADGMTDNRVKPTGRCHCGCGEQVGFGRYFATGHDKMSESAFVAVHHQGSIAQLLADHGYGPDNSITAKAVTEGGWAHCPADGCTYVGAPASIRNHQKKAGH